MIDPADKRGLRPKVVREGVALRLIGKCNRSAVPLVPLRAGNVSSTRRLGGEP